MDGAADGEGGEELQELCSLALRVPAEFLDQDARGFGDAHPEELVPPFSPPAGEALIENAGGEAAPVGWVEEWFEEGGLGVVVQVEGGEEQGEEEGAEGEDKG